MALLFTTHVSNASVGLIDLKDCIGDDDVPIKKIKTKLLGDTIYVEVHINTLSKDVSRGVEEFMFDVYASKSPEAPPIYSFETKNRMDIIVNFSFNKDKEGQIFMMLSFWGFVLSDTAIEVMKCYTFEISDFSTNEYPSSITR